jgi:hypothetical protein
VVDIRSPHVLGGASVDRAVLDQMVSMAAQVLSGAHTATEAWRAILGPATRIVLKFNHVGAGGLATNEPLAQALVTVLVEAGYDRSGLTLVEVPEAMARDLGTRPPDAGWGASIPVGQGSEELASYLYDADAVINVPLLKVHPIAGMSGAMKSLSFALIRHPARYHDGACSPYIGQVIGNKEVSSRLKLNVVNALRTVIRGGPDGAGGSTVDHGGLLLSFDPVAADAAGQDLLLSQRRSIGLEGGLEVPHLVAAAAGGVGRRLPHELERVPIVCAD